MSSNKEALEKLALHTDELAELNRKQSEINIFEILQVEKTEIRHSNILAWLLNPQESHGLGDSFLREFIKAVITNLKDRDCAEKAYYTIDASRHNGISNDIINDLDWWLAAEFYKVEVEREHDCKDIIVSGKGRISGEGDSGKDGFMIVIENKVKAKEGTKKGKPQTEVYFEELMDPGAKREDGISYSEFKKRMFVFLTPDGEFAADPHWAMITYDDIATALESVMNANKIPDSSALVINDYIKTIKKHITGDPEVIEICDNLLREDYSDSLNIILDARQGKYTAADAGEERLIAAITGKYEKAIETIENNHSDASYMVGQYIRKALRKISREEQYDIVLPDKFNQKTYIKFTTPKMTELLGGQLDDPVSPWGTKDKYYYEFDNRAQGRDKTKVSFFLILGGGDFLQKDDLLNRESQISGLLHASLAEDYTYKRCTIPDRKQNKETFNIGNTDNLEDKVERYVRKMVDAAVDAEAMIAKWDEEF